jgi:hypothetical protein
MASPAERRQQPSDGQPSEVLAGSIERVTFHNATNGFCVLRIKARGHRELVTVVGHAAEISAGKWIPVSGVWSGSAGPLHRATGGGLRLGRAGHSRAGLRLHDPQEQGQRILHRGDPATHPALRDSAV